jgi:hypothetical protein
MHWLVVIGDIQMNTLSFRDYVLTHSPEDSPAGDFIMDAKHPAAQKLPDVESWEDLENWLGQQGASGAAIDSAQTVWKRYCDAKEPITVPLGTLTVRQLIELLQRENPEAHVIKYHPGQNATASRVFGFSRVSITSGTRVVAAVMLE